MKNKAFITKLSIAGVILGVLGMFIRAVDVAIIGDINYWGAAGAEKYWLLGALIASLIVVMLNKHVWLRLTSLVALMAPVSPAISFEGNDSNMLTDALSKVTDPLVDAMTDFALNFLIDFSFGGICLLLGLIALLISAGLTFRRESK